MARHLPILMLARRGCRRSERMAGHGANRREVSYFPRPSDQRRFGFRAGRVSLCFFSSIRAMPTLLVDSEDGARELARHEGTQIDAREVSARLADGTYARADASAPAIRSTEAEPEPGAAALVRIKSGAGTLADVMAFLAARF